MNAMFVGLNLISRCLGFKSLVSTKLVVNRSISSLQIGSTAQLSRTFSEEDVKTFAKLSGDCNPIHLDGEYASQTKFGAPVVHGVLTLGLVSAVMGTILPGPGTVLTSQTINYTKPLFIDEEVWAQITVIGVEKRLIECKYICTTSSGKKVMDGTARLVLFN